MSSNIININKKIQLKGRNVAWLTIAPLLLSQFKFSLKYTVVYFLRIRFFQSTKMPLNGPGMNTTTKFSHGIQDKVFKFAKAYLRS